MKKRLIWLLLPLLCLIAAGCGAEDKEEAIEGNQVYYLNETGTKLVAEAFEPKGKTVEKQIEEYIKRLKNAPEDGELTTAFQSGVDVTNVKIDGAQVYLYFNEEYSAMTPLEEILLRAAVVRTLSQVEGVEGISFYVLDAPLKDANGNLVGIMTADSFVENPREQINTIESKQITLYFASADGKSLVAETREVYGNSNVSMEKLVMSNLMKGPETDQLLGTIPSGTRLLSVSTLDGVCFVNLDVGFTKHNYEIAENIVLFSIVNSLTELANVNKVQISVNGNTKMMYRTEYSLEMLYERNLDLIVKPEELEEEEEEEAND